MSNAWNTISNQFWVKSNIPSLHLQWYMATFLRRIQRNLQITNDQFSSNEKNFINIQDPTVNQFPGDGEAIRIQWKSQRAEKSSEVGTWEQVNNFFYVNNLKCKIPYTLYTKQNFLNHFFKKLSKNMANLSRTLDF